MKRYGEVLRQLYNIDELLIRNGRDLQHRPSVERLVSIAVSAAGGDFTRYDALIADFAREGAVNDRDQGGTSATRARR